MLLGWEQAHEVGRLVAYAVRCMGGQFSWSGDGDKRVCCSVSKAPMPSIVTRYVSKKLPAIHVVMMIFYVGV